MSRVTPSGIKTIYMCAYQWKTSFEIDRIYSNSKALNITSRKRFETEKVFFTFYSLDRGEDGGIRREREGGEFPGRGKWMDEWSDFVGQRIRITSIKWLSYFFILNYSLLYTLCLLYVQQSNRIYLYVILRLILFQSFIILFDLALQR